MPGNEENFMEVALALAFGLIIVAPFFGRWRANVWLRTHIAEPQTSRANNVVEIA